MFYFYIAYFYTFIACLCSAGGSVDDVCNKENGKCKCKPRVGGLKCDRTADGGYFLPSIGQYIFTVADIVPYARRIKRGNFYGSSVNGSFASVRLNLEITQPEQHFYVMIYYALGDRLKPRIDLEFSNNGNINSDIKIGIFIFYSNFSKRKWIKRNLHWDDKLNRFKNI